MALIQKVLAIIAQLRQKGGIPDVPSHGGTVAHFLPGSLNFSWVDSQICSLAQQGCPKIWVTREAIVFSRSNLHFIFPGGEPKGIPLPISMKLKILTPDRFDSCIQLLSPGITMETFGAIVNQNWMDQMSEAIACRGCKYYHGKEGLVCAVHPQGQKDCPDFERVVEQI